MAAAANRHFVTRPPKTAPDRFTRRPPEPTRPEHARRPGVSLLGTQVRRRRYRRMLPPGV